MTTKTATKTARKNSRAFTPHPNAKRRQFSIDRVPADLFARVTAKAKRDGVAVRSLVLAFLAEWSAS